MWNMLKIADRRVKRMKIWGLLDLGTPYAWYFWGQNATALTVWGNTGGNTCFVDPPKINTKISKFLLTQDHMGLKISKRYFSYSFDPI